MLLKNFKIFLKEVENQFGRKIKRIRSDRGSEYESSAFNSFVQCLRIIYETTMHGREREAERENITKLVQTPAFLSLTRM